VGALADGLAADVDDLLPVAGEHRLAERLGAVGVGPLPTMSTPASCRNGTAEYSDAAAGSTSGVRVTTSRPADALDDLAQVLGRRAAAAADEPDAVRRANSSSASASSTGCSGYSAPCLPSCGRPAFGMTDSGTVACRDR
jgi:hypothetical protein